MLGKCSIVVVPLCRAKLAFIADSAGVTAMLVAGVSFSLDWSRKLERGEATDEVHGITTLFASCVVLFCPSRLRDGAGVSGNRVSDIMGLRGLPRRGLVGVLIVMGLPCVAGKSLVSAFKSFGWYHFPTSLTF